MSQNACDNPAGLLNIKSTMEFQYPQNNASALALVDMVLLAKANRVGFPKRQGFFS